MFSFKLLVFLLLSSMVIVACGGGNGTSEVLTATGKKYCVLNTNEDHFSPNGSCFQIEKIELYDPSKDFSSNNNTIAVGINDDVYLSFSYDDSDFVGDVELFSFELNFESNELDQSHITIQEPLAFGGGWIVRSNKAGSMQLTLTVKEQGFVLDRKTVELTILK